MISSEVDKKKVKADSRGRYVLIVLSVFEKDLGIYRYDAGSPTRWLCVVVLCGWYFGDSVAIDLSKILALVTVKNCCNRDAKAHDLLHNAKACYKKINKGKIRKGERKEVAHPERFELPTDRFVADYSIQLSYGCAGC